MARSAGTFRYGMVVALTGAAIAAGAWWFSASSRTGAVILISIDTLRADRLPVYGYAKGRTPALDAFAKESVVFEHAYSHAPQTLPAHSSMLTGLLPFEHKVRDNLGFTLAAGATTLATVFRSAGYHTGGFASAYVLRPETGIGQGFDVFDAKFAAAAGDRSPGQIQRPGPETLAAATRWLDTLVDDRFLLFFHIYEPHKPYAPPERFAALDPYDGEVAFSDEIVGQLFAVLKRRGWYDHATIVVLSDHGEGLGDHGEQEHGLFLYDEAIHVPWIVKLAGGASAGRRISTPIQHIDLLPTLARVAGLAVPAGLRGRDLGPLMKGQATLRVDGIYSEALYARYHFGWSELFALTDDRYRYIKAPRDELYDLQRDPGERTNLVGERGQAVAAMRSGLEALVAGRDVDQPGAVSAEDRQRLAALGYVGTQTAGAPGPGSTLPDPKDMAPVLRKYRGAIEAIGAQRLDDAAAALKEIATANPGMADVWSQYAQVLLRLGRDEEALAAYKGMVRTHPDEPAALLGAASVLLTLGRFDEARAHAELALKNSPAAAHEALTNIALAKHDDREALNQAALAEQADPTLPLVPFARGMIAYNQQRYGDALPDLLKAHDLSAQRTVQTTDVAFFIGDALARLERYKEAEPFFLEETRLFPSRVRAHEALATLYQAMERPADAERSITDWLAQSPTPVVYRSAAKLYRMFGQPERAADIEARGRARFGGGRL